MLVISLLSSIGAGVSVSPMDPLAKVLLGLYGVGCFESGKGIGTCGIGAGPNWAGPNSNPKNLNGLP